MKLLNFLRGKKASAPPLSESPFSLPKDFTDFSPNPLNSTPPALPLTSGMLPSIIWDYASNAAYRMDDTPPDFVASAIICLIVSIAGGTVVVQPKATDTEYIEVLTLWVMLVGIASSKKSPGMNSGLQLYNMIQEYHDKVFEREMKLYDKDDPDSIKPKHKQLIVNDTTREALAIHLASNPNGVLVVKDELSGWLTDLSNEKNATARGFYLSGFTASKVKYVEKRVTRDSIELERIIISMIGAIQPDMLKRFLSQKVAGHLNDGLFERFQFMIYPEIYASYTDCPPNHQAKDDLIGLIGKLSEFSTKSEKAVTFKFSPEAQELYEKDAKLVIDKQNIATKENDTQTCSFLGKQGTLLAKLSLVFQLVIDCDRTEISVEAFNYAKLWVKYLDSHQKKINSLIAGDKLSGAEALLGRLGSLSSPFTASSFNNKGWKQLSDTKQRKQALDALVQNGYLYPETVKSPDGGRPKVNYHKHPSLISE
jgi:hypothetical protein